jgi:hypothetical protein
MCHQVTRCWAHEIQRVFGARLTVRRGRRGEVQEVAYHPTNPQDTYIHIYIHVNEYRYIIICIIHIYLSLYLSIYLSTVSIYLSIYI